MKILVLGGSGFVGHAIIRAFRLITITGWKPAAPLRQRFATVSRETLLEGCIWTDIEEQLFQAPNGV